MDLRATSPRTTVGIRQGSPLRAGDIPNPGPSSAGAPCVYPAPPTIAGRPDVRTRYTYDGSNNLLTMEDSGGYTTMHTGNHSSPGLTQRDRLGYETNSHDAWPLGR